MADCKLIIRPEQTTDLTAIESVIQRAFLTEIYSHQTEHLLVAALRQADALSISLVADYAGQIIGHLAFSAVTIEGQASDWYGLAPLAVDPDWQNQGIGSQLVQAGLENLNNLGAVGCVVLGDPQYYGRFGFKTLPDLSLVGVPAEYFQALAFKSAAVKGTVEYHAAFAICA